MKTIIALILLSAILATPAGATDPAPTSIASLDREVDDLTHALRAAQEQIADLQRRIDAIEKRLGETFRPVSPFDTIERRLSDLEKDLDRLKR